MNGERPTPAEVSEAADALGVPDTALAAVVDVWFPRYCPRCGTRRARPGDRCGVCSCPLDLTPDEVARRYPPLPGGPRTPASVRTADDDPYTSHEVASDDAERNADRCKD